MMMMMMTKNMLMPLIGFYGHQLSVIMFLMISDIIIVIIIPRQPAVWEILLASTASLVSCLALRMRLPAAQVIITRMDKF